MRGYYVCDLHLKAGPGICPECVKRALEKCLEKLTEKINDK